MAFEASKTTANKCKTISTYHSKKKLYQLEIQQWFRVGKEDPMQPCVCRVAKGSWVCKQDPMFDVTMRSEYGFHIGKELQEKMCTYLKWNFIKVVQECKDKMKENPMLTSFPYYFLEAIFLDACTSGFPKKEGNPCKKIKMEIPDIERNPVFFFQNPELLFSDVEVDERYYTSFSEKLKRNLQTS